MGEVELNPKLWPVSPLSYPGDSLLGVILPPSGHVAVSGDIFGGRRCAEAISAVYQVEARAAAQHRCMQCRVRWAPAPHEELSSQNVSPAVVEGG